MMYLDHAIYSLIMGKWVINHALLYLACEHTVFGVRLPNDELFTRAREPMHGLCMGIRHLHSEDLYAGVEQLQMVDMNWS